MPLSIGQTSVLYSGTIGLVSVPASASVSIGVSAGTAWVGYNIGSGALSTTGYVVAPGSPLAFSTRVASAPVQLYATTTTAGGGTVAVSYAVSS